MQLFLTDFLLYYTVWSVGVEILTFLFTLIAHTSTYSQSYGFSSSHAWMWEVDHKEGWVLKNYCFWIVVLEKALESSLDSKEIKPVNPKGNQP